MIKMWPILFNTHLLFARYFVKYTPFCNKFQCEAYLNHLHFVRTNLSEIPKFFTLHNLFRYKADETSSRFTNFVTFRIKLRKTDVKLSWGISLGHLIFAAEAASWLIALEKLGIQVKTCALLGFERASKWWRRLIGSMLLEGTSRGINIWSCVELLSDNMEVCGANLQSK